MHNPHFDIAYLTEKNRVQALALLRKDLINGPRHCFGFHTHCSPDFCTIVRDLQVQQPPTSQQPSQQPSQELPSSSGDTEDGKIYDDNEDDLDLRGKPEHLQ